MNSNVDYFTAVLATWLLGSCVSVVPPLLRPLNVAKQLAAVSIRHVFCGPCSIENLVEGIRILNKNKKDVEIQVPNRCPVELLQYIDDCTLPMSVKVLLPDTVEPNANRHWIGLSHRNLKLEDLFGLAFRSTLIC